MTCDPTITIVPATSTATSWWRTSVFWPRPQQQQGSMGSRANRNIIQTISNGNSRAGLGRAQGITVTQEVMFYCLCCVSITHENLYLWQNLFCKTVRLKLNPCLSLILRKIRRGNTNMNGVNNIAISITRITMIQKMVKGKTWLTWSVE